MVGLVFGVSITLLLRPVMLGVTILKAGVRCPLLLCGRNIRKKVNCGPLRASERLVCDVAELRENVTRWLMCVSNARRLLTDPVLCLLLGSAGLVRLSTVVIPVRQGDSSTPALPLVIRRT